MVKTKHSEQPDDLVRAEEVIKVDKYQLDVEWEAQPVLMHHYATALADARFACDQAKSHLKQTEAQLALDIRSSPAEYGIDKVTENAIGALTLLQPEYQTAESDYLRAKREMDQISAVVDALDHRKKALESLVYLHGQDYFGEPSARRAGENGMEKMNNPPRAKGVKKNG